MSKLNISRINTIRGGFIPDNDNFAVETCVVHHKYWLGRVINSNVYQGF